MREFQVTSYESGREQGGPIKITIDGRVAVIPWDGVPEVADLNGPTVAALMADTIAAALSELLGEGGRFAVHEGGIFDAAVYRESVHVHEREQFRRLRRDVLINILSCNEYRATGVPPYVARPLIEFAACVESDAWTEPPAEALRVAAARAREAGLPDLALAIGRVLESYEATARYASDANLSRQQTAIEALAPKPSGPAPF